MNAKVSEWKQKWVDGDGMSDSWVDRQMKWRPTISEWIGKQHPQSKRTISHLVCSNDTAIPVRSFADLHEVNRSAFSAEETSVAKRSTSTGLDLFVSSAYCRLLKTSQTSCWVGVFSTKKENKPRWDIQCWPLHFEQESLRGKSTTAGPQMASTLKLPE